MYVVSRLYCICVYCRFQAQKSAIRVCGDWSEHLSSSGKKYYYNLKTEISQWEKPRDWSDSWVAATNTLQLGSDFSPDFLILSHSNTPGVLGLAKTIFLVFSR